MNMFDFRDVIITILGIILSLIIIISFAGCRQVKTVTVTEYRDSIRTEYHTDSLLVYIKDSIYIKERNDTVYYNKYQILYKDRFVRDTIREREYIEKPVINTVEVEKRYIPAWVWWLVGANALGVVIAGVRMYLKFRC